MALLGKITDHAARARDRLLQQYRGKAKLAALIDNLSAQVQSVEDAFWDLWALRQLETSTGAQLDVLGRIVGIAREASNDATFRLRVRAKIRANRSSGTPEDVLQTLALLVATGTVLEYENQPPAGFVIKVRVLPVPTADLPVLLSFLQRAKAGGIRAILEYMTPGIADPLEAFTTARGTTLTAPLAIGGGALVNVVSTAHLTDGAPIFIADGSVFQSFNNGIQILSPTTFAILINTSTHLFPVHSFVQDSSANFGGGWNDEGDNVGGKLVSAALSS